MENEECRGCKNLEIPHDGLHCYMFKERPMIIPCMQHSDYSDVRNVVGKIILKSPDIISLFLKPL